MTTTTSSPVGRLLTRLLPIEPHEIRAVVAAFFLFFFMWAGYFAVRPVRETVGTLLGREQVADLWIVTAIASIALIPVYGAVVAYLRRSIFLPGIYACVAALLVFVGLALQGAEFNPLIGKTFYVFISVVNLLLISVFWSFLLELFEKGQTKRLFGVIAAGGSAGALAGPLISDLSVDSIGESGILFLGAALFVAAIVCQRVLLAIWKDRSDGVAGEDRPIGGNVFAGVTLVLRSPYLLGIALFIVGISAASTLLYFEQLRLVEINVRRSRGPHSRVRATRLDRPEPHGAVADLSHRAYCSALRRHRIAHDGSDRHGRRLPNACGVWHVRPVRHRHRRASLRRVRVRAPRARDALEPARQGDEVQSQEHDRRAGVSRCRRGRLRKHKARSAPPE